MSTQASTGFVADWYTPTDQRGEDVEKVTRYKVKPLHGLQMMEVAANGETNRNGEFMPSHKGRLLLLQNGVKDWENVTDDAGNVFAFNLPRLKFLPTAHLVELTNEILQRSVLGAEAEKN
jgi:hypothetical protein